MVSAASWSGCLANQSSISLYKLLLCLQYVYLISLPCIHATVNIYIRDGSKGRGGGDVRRARHTAQIFRHMLHTWQSDLTLSQSQWEGRKKAGEKKVTVTQGGTQTHDLANGQPCSNQLNYWVTWQLSGWIRVLKAELPGIQPKRIPSWHVRWGDTGSDF